MQREPFELLIPQRCQPASPESRLPRGWRNLAEIPERRQCHSGQMELHEATPALPAESQSSG